MTDQYLPDNAPRDILLSLQELSQKNIPHAATFKLAAARIAELEAALKPFADGASNFLAEDEDHWMIATAVPALTIADLRAARAAYLGEKE
jgi:hypothetical protein